MRPLLRLAALLGVVGIFSSMGTDARGGDELPVVVLIGDSIRIGYAPFVAECLEGKAEVVSSQANGFDSANVLAYLDEWAIDLDPAVIHFNAGLHDIKVDRSAGTQQVSLDNYKANLGAILRRLEAETNARLIFATTTPVDDARHNAVKPFDRSQSDVERYNAAAREVLAKSPHLNLNDLHAVAEGLGLETALVADGVHFNEEASRVLGEYVAAVIEDAIEGPEVTREAVCRWTDTPPVIDGKIDDPCWEHATIIDRFAAFWDGTVPETRTVARLLWDDDALYFAAEMTDEELRAFGTERNDQIWNGDVFELFFKPFEDRPEYYEFQVNPRSVILELAFPHRGFSFEELAARPPMGFEAVARVDGTLDQPGDTDRGWTVEGRIPWSIFEPSGGRPEPGSVWRFALCRYDYGPEGTEPVLMSSAPLRRRSFHQYEDYGHLTFEGPEE